MSDLWPPLPYEDWRDTQATLHRYCQIVGKVKLALTPRVNHDWNVTFEVTPSGLSTGRIPYQRGIFAVDFDFHQHQIQFRASDGSSQSIALSGQPVADMYREIMERLESMGVNVKIWDHPVEIPSEAIPFHEDRKHASYDREPVTRLLRVLASSSVVFDEFRARFTGKASPVHFFWGSFDLATTRHSGEESSSLGWWAGDEKFPEPAFFAYHAPRPPGLFKTRQPDGVSWRSDWDVFVLPYERVRTAPDPRAALLDFAQSTYEAGAKLAGWNRQQLERT